MKITKDYLKQIIKEAIEEVSKKRDFGPVNVDRTVAQNLAGTKDLASDPKRSLWKDMDPASKQRILNILNSEGKKNAYYMEHQENSFPEGTAWTNLDNVVEDYNFLLSLGYQPKYLKQNVVPVINTFKERLAGYLVVGSDGKATSFDAKNEDVGMTWKKVKNKFDEQSDDDEDDEG